jgi:hypothetical protein
VSPIIGYRIARATTPAQDRAIVQARAHGARVADLADAYGVTVRTIYRVLLRGVEPTVDASVGDWKAPFLLTDEGPIQVTPWVPA